MFGIGWTEVLIILVVALLVLGPTKLPEIAKALGKGIREFRHALSSLDEPTETQPTKASYSAEVSDRAAQEDKAVDKPPAPPSGSSGSN